MRLRSLTGPSTGLRVLPALLLPLTLALTGCGGDDEPAAGGSGSSSVEDAVASEGTEQSDPGDPGFEDLDDLTDPVDEALTNGSAGLDTIASAIDTVLDNINGYEIDGNDITLLADSGSPGTSSACVIASSVLGSFDVPEDATISVKFPDGTEECSI